MPKMEMVEFTNRIDLAEVGHTELPYLEKHYLATSF